MTMNIKTFGPAPTWDELDKDLAIDHRLWSMPFKDVRIFCDGPIVAVGQFANEPETSVYLRIEADCTHFKGAYPQAMERVAHYLEFSSRAELEATLHEETVPTVESYRKAKSIVREICKWTLLASGKAENCSIQIANVNISEIPEAEMPYAHLLPGTAMQFEGADDEALSTACGTHYRYPLPQDDVLSFHDIPRVWIGKTEFFGKPSYNLRWLIEDSIGREVSYRLSFDSEEALRATLYQGCAATQETFRQAKSIAKEVLSVEVGPPAAWTLHVDHLTIDNFPPADLPNDDLQPGPKSA
jgi:hypothetical protein